MQQLAVTDAQAFRSILLANGKSMTDDAHADDLAWRQGFYAAVGRVEYVNLRSASNMGSSSIAFSSLGRPLQMANGPTWGADEMGFAALGAHVRINENIMPASPNWGFIQVGYGMPRSYGGGYGAGYNGRNIFSKTGNPKAYMMGNDSTTDAWGIDNDLAWHRTERGFLTTILTGENSAKTSRNGNAWVNSFPAGGAGYSSLPLSGVHCFFSNGGSGDIGAQSTTLRGTFATWPIPAAILEAKNSELRNLYKTTIGKVLGLP